MFCNMFDDIGKYLAIRLDPSSKKNNKTHQCEYFHHFQKHKKIKQLSLLFTVYWSDGSTTCCFAKCPTLKATLKVTICKRVFTRRKKSSAAIYFFIESKRKIGKKDLLTECEIARKDLYAAKLQCDALGDRG